MSADASLVRQLDNLPARSAESKCIHLLGAARVCFVGAVLGTSLVGAPDVADGGVLNLLRNRGLAAPSDVFVISFGVWHAKQNEAGYESYRLALRRLADDFARNRGRWPHVFFRETPASHEKDWAAGKCLPAVGGELLLLLRRRGGEGLDVGIERGGAGRRRHQSLSRDDSAAPNRLSTGQLCSPTSHNALQTLCKKTKKNRLDA